MYRRQKKTSKNFHFQPKTNVNLTSETDVNATSIQLILPAGNNRFNQSSGGVQFSLSFSTKNMLCLRNERLSVIGDIRCLWNQLKRTYRLDGFYSIIFLFLKFYQRPNHIYLFVCWLVGLFVVFQGELIPK